MISATEALRAPTAQLSEEEYVAANKLEVEIEAHVLQNMTFGGCDFVGKETNPKVLAVINQRLKEAGWLPQWKIVQEKHRLNAALTQTVGFHLTLSPNDEAYRTNQALFLRPL